MLILTRNHLEAIKIGDDVVVTVLEVNGDQVRLGVTVPQGALLIRNKPATTQHSLEASEK